MSNIFRLKYKMHRIVNILFYAIFFIAGYYTAVFINKPGINVKEFIQQLLGG